MRLSILTILLASLTATGAIAQKAHNSNAPIDFGADHIELQAELTLNSARLTVAYTGEVVGGNPQVSRLDASGGVTVKRPDQAARSQYAIYDLNRRVITMLGAVTLTQQGNTVNGGRLTMNLDTGRAVIDGSSVASSSGAAGSGRTVTQSGGRVTGTFSVPKRN
jgi:lipopolysaccharide export system protein LptA